MPSEESMKKARDIAMRMGPGGHAGQLLAQEIAAVLESADASGYARGRAEAVEECLSQQPCTAENPNENAYQRGKFDGVMEFAKNIHFLS